MSDEFQKLVSPEDLVVDEVVPLDGFRIWVRISDGTEGELDLTEQSKKPWFQAWQDRRVFENVWIPSHGDGIRWGNDPKEFDMGFCLTWLYYELTGEDWVDVSRKIQLQPANA